MSKSQVNLKAGDKVTVTESDGPPFQAVVRSVSGTAVYIEGSSIPAYLGNVEKV